ncbi:phosphatase PAP2 family protein [Saccharopolyspora antimicrobica]|uniref:phosphatase PAP2 family protein n=1 Tax=Saccharopolyspora antimicrobica TaxID=455193 RepID=UPI001160C682|nr:phosphatase PAP2 family protein [Saccharopolyspora antimicrobica]
MVLDSPRPFRAALPLLASACVIGLAAICALFVWTPSGQLLDQQLLDRADRGSPAYSRAMELLAITGDPLVLAGLLTAVLVVGALCGRWRAGLAGAIAFAASIVASRLLKLVLPRPDLDIAGSTTHNSFPSGHVTAAAGLLIAFLLVLPPRARWWFAVPGAAGVAAVGAATMTAGWHRLSDVVGAVLLAAAFGCAAAWATGRQRRVVTEP